MTPVGYRRLILTRHAKSDWDNPGQTGIDRPLNARGRRAARMLGDWLASRNYDPEEVLFSTAARTRETWEVAEGAALGTRPEVRQLSALYNAAPDSMLQILRGTVQQTVMMIGHNPGIAELAAILPASPVTHPDFYRFPTSATLVLDFHLDDWANLQPGTGSVLDFVRFEG